MSSVVTFGEVMMRLATQRRERFTQAREFEVTYGGGECNVAVSLSNFGIDTTFISAIPKNDIGQSCINYIRQFGVNTNSIIRSGNRLGIYFIESGASMRASKVIYDRSGSSISEIKPGDIDWEKIFSEKNWFHFTGITPAISTQASDTCKEAAQIASDMGLVVSADMNYRKNLWSPEEAQKTMKPLMKFVDIVIGNEEDAEKCLGVSPENVDVTSGNIDPNAYKPVIEKLQNQYNFKKIAITLRESISADDNNWSAIYFDGKEIHTGKKYPVRIVDRVGGCDAFASGIIYGNLQKNWSSQQILDFAVASSAISHTFHGDFNLVSIDEVNSIAKGDTSGRVQR